MEQFKYGDITRRIIGCAMQVHSALGTGYQEKIYQRALAMEMDKNGLFSAREYEIPIKYKGKLIGTRRVDFFVENKVMVEIKATGKIENVHLTQAKNYLEASQLDTGLLINFGELSLTFKRLFLS